MTSHDQVLATLAQCRDLLDLARVAPKTTPADSDAWRACAFFVHSMFSIVPDGATPAELREFLRLARTTHADGNLKAAGLASLEEQCARRGVR